MRNVRFLIVDDSAMTRKLIASVVRNKLGAESILTASDGREALRLLEKNTIDLIVSDWNMGDMNGDELLYAVRHHPKHKNTPFVMVTTNNRREFILTAVRLGVTQYVVKPFTPAELEQKIRASWTAANKRRAERYASLPEHRAAVRCDVRKYAATLVNLSRSGALLRLRYDSHVELFRSYELSAQFENDDSNRQWNIKAIRGHAVRLEADDPTTPACLMAIEFNIGDLPDAGAHELVSLLEYLSTRTPTVIDN